MSAENIRKIDAVPIIKKIFSTIFLIIGFVAVSWTSYISSRPKEEEIVTYDGVRHIIVTLFITCLFLFLYIRTQMVYNAHLRRKYSGNISKKERLNLVLSSFDYWFDILGFAFLFIAFDLNAVSPVLAELCSSDSAASVKIKAVCMIIPAIAVLDLLARYSAISGWFQSKDEYIQKPSLRNDDPMAKNTSKLAPTVKGFSAMRFLARTYSVNSTVNPDLEQQEEKRIAESFFTITAKIKSFVWVVIPIALMVLLSKYLYSTVVALGWLAITLICNWKTWAVAGVLIGAMYSYRIIRAFYNRYKFLQKLKKICRTNKYKLSKIKNAYSSLFKLRGNQDFCVTVSGITYSCEFISHIKQTKPLIFHKDGSAAFVRGITFAGVNWFQSAKKFDFEYESKCPQILIINPTMKFVYEVDNGAIKELDNGDSVGKYRVYTGNSFINALERNCIEQSNKKKMSYY